MFKGIASIIFLSAAIMTFFMLTKPLYFEVKDLNAQKVSFEEALSSSRQIQETKDKLLSQYNTIPQEDIERLNKIIPSQPGAMKFILEIESMARKNGIILKNIDVKDVSTQPASENVSFGGEVKLWETVPFNVKISGPYRAFYLFLGDMEKNLRLTDISEINFSAGETNFYEFNVAGTFYWKK